MTGDGKPELICAENKYGTLAVFDSLGNPLPNFPIQSTENDWRTAIAADLDNDNTCDIAVGSNSWNLFGINSYGEQAIGFPLALGNYTARSSPAAFDIDLDGKLELMVGACDFKFSVYDLNSAKYEWPKFRYDQYNTGVYRSPYLYRIKETASHIASHAIRFEVYPSPFSKKTEIRFTNYDLRSTSIKIYDATGRVVKSFALRPSPYALSVVWHGQDDHDRSVPAGVYFVRLEAGDYEQTEKVVLLR
jgi:hypothetical protein